MRFYIQVPAGTDLDALAEKLGRDVRSAAVKLADDILKDSGFMRGDGGPEPRGILDGPKA